MIFLLSVCLVFSSSGKVFTPSHEYSFNRLVCTLQCYRGLTEGWEKILGLYSSVRDKGKEVLAQVDFFTIKHVSSKKTFLCIFFGSNHQENEEVMLESKCGINSAPKVFHCTRLLSKIEAISQARDDLLG